MTQTIRIRLRQMKTAFEKKLRKALRRFEIGPDMAVVVAVSGGADSTALLDALVRMRDRQDPRIRIVAAHLNHLLRAEESDGDERFVRDLAGKLGVELCVERSDVAALRDGRNLEATARELRYDLLRRCAKSSGADLVMTAHTRDDQAETVLMRLIRGTGIHGLRGIHAVRPLGPRVSLVRPMLDISRAEVIDHCSQRELDWRTDSSNFSIDLTRNRIRHELMPLLRSFNPAIDRTLAREARIARIDSDCLDRLAAELPGVVGLSLSVSGLAEVHPAIRLRAIRIWLFGQTGSHLESAHLEAVEGLIEHGRSGRRIELPGGWIVMREFDLLTLRRSTEAPPPPEPVALTEDVPISFGDFSLTLSTVAGGETFNINDVKKTDADYVMLDAGVCAGAVRVRARKPGDAYIPAGGRHRIKLKTLMIRHKIPLHLRDTYPVVTAADDSIIWAPGLPAAEGCSAVDGRPAIIITALPAAETRPAL